MKIKITRAFIDRQAKNVEDREVPAGKVIDVSTARAKELIDLQLAVAETSKPTAAS